VAQDAGLLLSQDEDLSRTVGEALEHPSRIAPLGSD
jgi:hypothetical protein